MGERVKDSRAVPGMGDEAAIVYHVAAIRPRAAYPVVKPLSPRVAEQGALVIGRRLVSEFK
jgi:hypothetical protein